jgi:hypothetical protein
MLVSVRYDDDLVNLSDPIAFELSRGKARHRRHHFGGSAQARNQGPIQQAESRGIACWKRARVCIVNAHDMPCCSECTSVPQTEQTAAQSSGKNELLPQVSCDSASGLQPDFPQPWNIRRRRREDKLKVEISRKRAAFADHIIKGRHDLARIALDTGQRLRQKSPVDGPVSGHTRRFSDCRSCR